MARPNPRRSPKPANGATPASLATRLLRRVQSSAGLGGSLQARDSMQLLSALSERAAALQLLRVSVETMAEICADADRACDRAIHATDEDERASLTARAEERIRDLIAAGGRTAMSGFPPLVRGAWMLNVTLPSGDPFSARIPGLRATGALEATIRDTMLQGRNRLDAIQRGIAAIRVQIRDSRIAILGVLETLSAAFDEADAEEA